MTAQEGIGNVEAIKTPNPQKDRRASAFLLKSMVTVSFKLNAVISIPVQGLLPPKHQHGRCHNATPEALICVEAISMLYTVYDSRSQ